MWRHSSIGLRLTSSFRLRFLTKSLVALYRYTGRPNFSISCVCRAVTSFVHEKWETVQHTEVGSVSSRTQGFCTKWFEFISKQFCSIYFLTWPEYLYLLYKWVTYICLRHPLHQPTWKQNGKKSNTERFGQADPFHGYREKGDNDGFKAAL